MEALPRLGKHHGGSHREYMVEKKRKLRDQFDQHARVGPSLGHDLFRGICVYVDGYTEPSWDEIKCIMAEHGGRFENYYSRERVTHIICTHLPESKVQQILNERKPAPEVVRPEWINECLKQGKVLPAQDFGLACLQRLPGQETLDKFRQLKGPVQVETEPNHAAHDAGLPECKKHALEKALKLAEEARRSCDVLGGRPKSTLDDPDFMSNFFKASRLHFIGTWKNRMENLVTNMETRSVQETSGNQLHCPRSIIHVDMDCFFASVATLQNPAAKGFPLVVCHSNSNQGKAEISSANYEARKFGIRANMFVGEAKKLCPQLIVMPYQFELYQETSETVYRTLFELMPGRVQPVSCDEAYIDVTGLSDPMGWATKIREEISRRTGCTASAGVSCNMLLAKIATGKAKPNGQLFLSLQDGSDLIGPMNVRELPGVGWSTRQKLSTMGISTCADLRRVSKHSLQQEFGEKSGEALYNSCRGIDRRKIELSQARKTIGAEVNWGIRFEQESQVINFLGNLCSEVQKRLKFAGVKGRSITLKLKRKAQGAKEPYKLLGHGHCDNLSKTMTVTNLIADEKELMDICLPLWQEMHCPPSELRGIGVSVSRLTGDRKSEVSPMKRGSIMDFLVEKRSSTHEKECSVLPGPPQPGQLDVKVGRFQQRLQFQSCPSVKKTDAEDECAAGSRAPFGAQELPPFSQVDQEIFLALPLDVRQELEHAYTWLDKAARRKNIATRKCLSRSKKSPKRNCDVPNRIGMHADPAGDTTCMTLTQVDPGVLAELPEQIQNEVKATYRSSRQTVRPKLFEEREVRSIEKTESEGVLRGILEQSWPSFEQELVDRCHKIQEILNYGTVDEFNAQLSTFEWVLCNVCEQMVKDDLEKFHRLVRWLHRSEFPSSEWKRVVDQVIHRARELVRKTYNGGTLRLQTLGDG